MKKTLALCLFCLLFSLSLSACTAHPDESSVPSTENNPANTDTSAALANAGGEITADTYYRMTYTKEPNVDEIMNALLTEEAEKEAYQTAEVKELASAFTDRTSQEWSMTVDGIDYRWTAGNGALAYFTDRPYESIEEALAEEIARDFLARLGWESSDDLLVKTLEDGTVEIECRLYYNGVKLMGQNSLFFELDNEDEIPVTGFSISMLLSKDRIQSLRIDAVPQAGEILQTYDAATDFLTLEKVETAARQYLEMWAQSLPSDMVDVDLTQENLEMEAEIIYMPYRDLANGDLHVLMPVFEIHVPTIPGSFTSAIVLYMDAVTGYIYDQGVEF